MRVILASNNENKLREMQAILSPLGWEILRQKDVGLHLEPRRKRHALLRKTPKSRPWR